MSEERDGLYDKYRVIKTEDLDRLAKIAEGVGPDMGGTEISKQATETIKWVEMVSISGMNDKGVDGSQFVFVLRPDKDFHAWVALWAYAASVTAHNSQLAGDLFDALGLIDAPTNMEPD